MNTACFHTKIMSPKSLKNRPLTGHTGVLSKKHENESDASEMPVESLKMTQVKQIQSSNTNRMVKLMKYGDCNVHR